MESEAVNRRIQAYVMLIYTFSLSIIKLNAHIEARFMLHVKQL